MATTVKVYEPGKNENTPNYTPIVRSWAVIPGEGDLVSYDGKVHKVGSVLYCTPGTVSPAAETAAVEVWLYMISKVAVP